MSKQNRSKQRALTLLRLVAKGSTTVRETNQADTLLLEIEGARRLKCPTSYFQHWLQSGLVDMGRNGKLIVKDEGHAHLKRADKQDTATQHRDEVAEQISIGDRTADVTLNCNESPLRALFVARKNGTRAWLDDSEFQAGERLRMDFERSQLGPNITSSWDPAGFVSYGSTKRAPSDDKGDGVYAAKSRFTGAVESVGPELSGVLLDVCCFLKGLEQVERERRWPRRSAKLVLKLALATLWRHYNPQQSHSLSSKKRHWGSDGFRPAMK